MFKEIFKKKLEEDPKLNGLIDEVAKREIHEMVGSILEKLDAVPEDAEAEISDKIAAHFGTEMQEEIDKITEEAKSEEEVALEERRDLLAHLRKKSRFAGDPTKWEAMNDFEAEARKIEKSGMGLNAIEHEISAILSKNKDSYGPLTRRLGAAVKEKLDAGEIGEDGFLSGEPDPRLYQEIMTLLKQGNDPNERSYLQEYPIELARELGRWDILWLLMEQGANISLVGWDNAHLQLLFGTDEGFEKALEKYEIPRLDKEGKTLFDLCLHKDDFPKFKMLVEVAMDRFNARDIPLATALSVIEVGRKLDYLQVLVDAGLTLQMMQDRNVLHIALAEQNDALVAQMLEQGADVNAIQNLFPHDDEDISYARAQALLSLGWDHNRLLAGGNADQMRLVTGACLATEREFTADDFENGRHQYFGDSNPQLISKPYWKEAIRSGRAAANFREEMKISATEAPPVWCFDRVGATTSKISESRWLQIGGRHGEGHDPDHLIYNDVVVHDGTGRAKIYTYPRSVFPPTEFHSATDVGDELILLIGNQGYAEEMRVGHTQVYALDLRDFSMRPLATNGEAPGWISRHQADLIGDEVHVFGGNVETKQGVEPLTGRYALTLTTATWRRLDV